jgi:O-glycosyl hydrolase
MTKSNFRLTIAAFLCAGLSLYARANTALTVTVNAGATHEFKGLGASTAGGSEYNNLPVQTRETIAKTVWEELRFTVLRLRADQNDGNDSGVSFMAKYGLNLRDVQKVNPNIKLLFSPGLIGSDYQGYAANCAQLMKKLKDKFGLLFDALSLDNNSSGANSSYLASTTNEMVTTFREELDTQGLASVKIVAPECGDVSNAAFVLMQPIIDDPIALAGLHAFSTHSYNVCVSKQMMDFVKPYHKEYWQTEAASNGPEGFHDSAAGVYGAARILSDINLGANVWLWFLAYMAYDSLDNQTRMIGYDPINGNFDAFMIFYYMRLFSRTFDVGAQIRLCACDNPNYIYMENGYGLKPPVCACAGVNPDDSWGIALTNYTGVTSTWSGTSTCPADNYVVTVDVKELESSPDMQFQVYRCNDGSRNVRLDDVTMSQGKVTVTLHPMDMIALRPSFDMNFTELPPPKDNVFSDTCGNCGKGVSYAFIPVIGIRCILLMKRREKNAHKGNRTA